jgi:malate dehydrogenase (oxaloacetate-decarboxylating)(NADP+)
VIPKPFDRRLFVEVSAAVAEAAAASGAARLPVADIRSTLDVRNRERLAAAGG